jgi:hypothetical protein
VEFHHAGGGPMAEAGLALVGGDHHHLGAVLTGY